MDSYHYNRMAPVSLGAAPELVDGVVFVPLHFFGNVFPDGAQIADGNILINSELDDWRPPVSARMATAELLDEYDSFVEFIEFEDFEGEEHPRLLIVSNALLHDFRFIEVGFDDEDFIIYERESLFTAEEISPDMPFVVTWINWGTLPHRGISFTDENGNVRNFTINLDNASDIADSIVLIEFFAVD